MTYEDAIQAIRFDGMTIEAKASRYVEFCEGIVKAEEALKKAEKYKPHNLVKNPDDLPPVGEDVLVSIKGGKVNRTWREPDGFVNPQADSSRYYKIQNVLAWRFIEPF